MSSIDSSSHSGTKSGRSSRRSTKRSTSSANSGLRSQLSDLGRERSLTQLSAKSQNGKTSKRTLPSALVSFLFLMLLITFRTLSTSSEPLGRLSKTSSNKSKANSRPQVIRPKKRKKQCRTSKAADSKDCSKNFPNSLKASKKSSDS